MIGLMTLTLGCTSIQPFHSATTSPDTSQALNDLSFKAHLELYVIENEASITEALKTVNLHIPRMVTEATAADKRNIDCLARNIYWEASNEPIKGKAAVAQVTVNRTQDDRFPQDICGVVYDRAKVKTHRRVKTICQFSWTCMRVKGRDPHNADLWAESLEVAQKFVLDGQRLEELNEALFYHATYVKPRWAKQMIRIEKIGNHIFYRERMRQNGIYMASN